MKIRRITLLLALSAGVAMVSAHAQTADSTRVQGTGANSQASSLGKEIFDVRAPVSNDVLDLKEIGGPGTVTPQWGYQCYQQPDGTSVCCSSDNGGRHCS